MDPNSFPTKGNLILAQNSLALARQGYELMDKKRNILIKELMELIDKADEIQGEILYTYKTAYDSLKKANIDLGIKDVMDVAGAVEPENGVKLKLRSIMGCEIPKISLEEREIKPTYSFYGSTEALDMARISFERVKKLSIMLAEIENSAYRLAYSVKKTKKRANALKNITIPHYEELVKSISNALEEKEREEFTRLKVIKRRLNATGK